MSTIAIAARHTAGASRARLALTVLSLAANLILAIGWYQSASDYAHLQAWACSIGNGGAECGEE